jgi:cbb3-type cytochrome oxidase subunit 3
MARYRNSFTFFYVYYVYRKHEKKENMAAREEVDEENKGEYQTEDS